MIDLERESNSRDVQLLAAQVRYSHTAPSSDLLGRIRLTPVIGITNEIGQ